MLAIIMKRGGISLAQNPVTEPGNTGINPRSVDLSAAHTPAHYPGQEESSRGPLAHQRSSGVPLHMTHMSWQILWKVSFLVTFNYSASGNPSWSVRISIIRLITTILSISSEPWKALSYWYVSEHVVFIRETTRQKGHDMYNCQISAAVSHSYCFKCWNNYVISAFYTFLKVHIFV